MPKYLASVGVYSYEKDKVAVECFRTDDVHDWKRMLVLHSEFQDEIAKGGKLEWLSGDLNEAKIQLDNNDIQVDIMFTALGEEE